MLWRFVLCSAAYVFLYYLAGMIIFPYVRDFYATQHIPGVWRDRVVAVLPARTGVRTGLPAAVAYVSTAAPGWSAGGRIGVHPAERSGGADHAQPVLPRLSAVGSLLAKSPARTSCSVAWWDGFGDRHNGLRISRPRTHSISWQERGPAATSQHRRASADAWICDVAAGPDSSST